MPWTSKYLLQDVLAGAIWTWIAFRAMDWIDLRISSDSSAALLLTFWLLCASLRLNERGEKERTGSDGDGSSTAMCPRVARVRLSTLKFRKNDAAVVGGMSKIPVASLGGWQR